MIEITRKKESSLQGHTEVIFNCEKQDLRGEDLSAARLTATPFGVELVSVGGFYIEGMEELQEFAKIMSDAWKEHLKLKPKIEIVGDVP